MENHGIWFALLTLVKKVALTDLVILVFVVLVCLFVGHTRLYDLGSGLVLGGILCIGVGVESVIGSWSSHRSFTYLYGESVSESRLAERTQQSMQDLVENYRDSGLLGIAGIFAVAMGTVFQVLT